MFVLPTRGFPNYNLFIWVNGDTLCHVKLFRCPYSAVVSCHFVFYLLHMNSDTLSVVFLSFCILPSEDKIYIGVASLTLEEGVGFWP